MPAETQRGNEDKRTQFLRKIYLSLYLKGLCVRGSWRPNRTATYWPPLLWPQQRFFPVLIGCSIGGLGTQPLWDMVLIPASSLQLTWTPTAQSGMLVLSTASYLQLTRTSCAPSYIIVLRHPIQPVDSQGYPLDIFDRIHLLFTQVHFLFWQLGRGQYATSWPHHHLYIPELLKPFGLLQVFLHLFVSFYFRCFVHWNGKVYMSSFFHHVNIRFGLLARIFIGLVWFGWVSLFNGISTFVGYLMPKPFSKKDRGGTIKHIAGRIRGFIPFPRVFARKWT